jgi:serine protease AprX
MRYSVTSQIHDLSKIEHEVKNAGGKNIVVAVSSKQIFCDLEQSAIARLRDIGIKVTQVGKISTEISAPIISPPVPIAGTPMYSPSDLSFASGIEELRHVVDPPLYGAGMNIAIIDTGIREDHVQINGRVTYRKNYTEDTMIDGFNHGTGVASIVTTMAPQCNILNLKVLNDKGEGSEESVTLAIDDCISAWDNDPDNAPYVINLSLGSQDDGNPDNPIRVACRAAIQKGIWVFASAGNSGPGPYTVTTPAVERYVIAVGSCSFNPIQVSSFSSRGPTLEGLIKPDGVMFGENIVVASSASPTSTEAKSGTSFSCPFTSAMGLLYMEGVKRKARTTQQLVELPPGEVFYISVYDLVDNYLPRLCVKPSNAPKGKDTEYGYGVPYAPLVAKALQPGIDVNSILEFATIGMLMAYLIRSIGD